MRLNALVLVPSLLVLEVSAGVSQTLETETARWVRAKKSPARLVPESAEWQHRDCDGEETDNHPSLRFHRLMETRVTTGTAIAAALPQNAGRTAPRRSDRLP
jgi:hypothetical protein